MQLIRRYRVPAILCAVSVLLCELISRPYTNMGIVDDGPYIQMAHTLAATGHIVYNGWAAPMLGWQLYLGAAFIKLFGFSFTAARASTLLVAVILAWLLQRTLVLAGVSECNASVGTLALVLSPLYLMLSTTFMTDIFGLFAVLICLYGCLRALRASTQGAAIAWLCFAIAASAVCGTTRQIAWLGVLIMVPSALWLFRAQRPVLLAGAAVNLVGAVFIAACMLWLKHQPYVVTVHLIPRTFPIAHVLGQLIYLFLDAPFLLLPLFAIFLPELRRAHSRLLAVIVATFLVYFFLAICPSHLRGNFPLEPTLLNGSWVSVHGIPECNALRGQPPLFLNYATRLILTIVCMGGLAGLIATVLRAQRPPIVPTGITLRRLGVLIAPFTIVYVLLLIPLAAGTLFDRYLLLLMPFALLYLLRIYQERVQTNLSLAAVLLIAFMTVCGIAYTHNMFSFYRARVALASELRAGGVADISVDYGWENNLDVELQHSNHINLPTIAVPANAYVPVQPPPPTACQMLWYNYTPHIHPIYGLSFDPNVCYGPAPFAPVHFSRWPFRNPGTLYVVYYMPPPRS